MMTRRISCLGVAAILTYLCAPSGCSSSTDGNTTSPVNGTGGTSSTTTAGPSTTSTGAAGDASSTTTGAGGETTGTAGSGAAGTATSGAGGASGTDPSCTTALAKSQAPCTQDCNIACGFNAIGTKTCTCMGGFYSSCPCPKPPAFMGAAMAPYCNTPDGMTTGLKGMPCDMMWAECIGKDPNTGTPAGCACMMDPKTNTLIWACGSTNKWFSLAM